MLRVRGRDRAGSTFDPSAFYALYMPFSAVNPTYRSGTTKTNTLSALPGYSYTRSGATKLETEFLGYGDELVANGGFDSDTVWSKGTGVTISGGVANANGTQGTYETIVQQSNPTFVSGTTYRISFDTTSTAGALQLLVGATAIQDNATAGNYTATYTHSGATAALQFRDRGNTASRFVGTIDNVSVQQVYPQVTTTTLGAELVTNGTFDTDVSGWTSYSNSTQTWSSGTMNVAVTTNTAGAQQTIPTVIGRTYRIAATFSNITTPNCRIAVYDAAISSALVSPAYSTTAGTKTYDFVATTTTSVVLLQGYVGGSFNVDNISVKEVLHDGLSYLGPELVANGGFDVDANWAKTGGTTISGGTLNMGAGEGAYSTYFSAIVGRTYSITFTVISGTVSVGVAAGIGTNPAGTYTAGTYTVSTVASGQYPWLNASTAAVVDNYSLKEVIPEAFITFPSNTPGIVPKVGYYSRAAVTNLLLQSQAFDDAVWGKTNSTISANSALAPDGTLTMDKMVEDATTNQHQMLQTSGSLTSGSVYTISIYGKAGERPRTAIYEASFTGLHATFDWSTGTVVETTGAAIISAKMQSIVGGIYRASITFTAGGTGTTNFVLYMLAAGLSGPVAYAGDGTSGVYLWQAQLVAGSQPGPIIPTTTATAAVGADALSVTTPTLVDEDFILEVSAALPTYVPSAQEEVLSLGTAYANSMEFYRQSGTGNLSTQVVASSTSVFNVSSGFGVGFGATVMILRRRSGKWTFATRTGGFSTVGAESGALAMPIGINVANIGEYVNGSAQTNGSIRFVGIKKGTFSDADITTLLGTL